MNYSERFLSGLITARDLGATSLNCVATLAFLSRRENGCYMAGIARLLKVSSAAVTATVDTLEGMNFVRRSPVEGDRRQFRITITAAGRDAMDLILNPKTNPEKNV